MVAEEKLVTEESEVREVMTQSRGAILLVYVGGGHSWSLRL